MKKLFIIILYPFLLFSQGEYLNDNISGIAAGASYSANKLLEGNSVAAGFSILSKVDIGFEYANFHSKASLNRNYKVSGKLIYAAYNSKRKNNRTNLKVLLGHRQM